MRIVLAKLCLAAYLCVLVGSYTMNKYLAFRLQTNIMDNIQDWELGERNLEFCRLYMGTLLCCLLGCSAIMVVSRSLLPKLLTIVGVILWTLLARSRK